MSMMASKPTSKNLIVGGYHKDEIIYVYPSYYLDQYLPEGILITCRNINCIRYEGCYMVYRQMVPESKISSDFNTLQV